jgi:hypothetical protein
VFVDLRPELDFLDLDLFLVLLGLPGALLLQVLEAPVVHDAADGRHGRGRDLDEVEPLLARAIASACAGAMMPSCSPVSSMTRISRTRIRSFTRARSSRRMPRGPRSKAMATSPGPG